MGERPCLPSDEGSVQTGIFNRIDEHVIFNRLDKPALRKIVSLEIKRLQNRLNDKDIQIGVSDDALDWLTDIGFDPVYGARPLKRTIQKELETVVARGILDGRFEDGDSIMVDVFENKLDVYKTACAAFTTKKTKKKNRSKQLVETH